MRLNASSLPRLEKCAASAALPGVATEGDASNLGKDVHGFLERVQRMSAEKSLEQVTDPDSREMCSTLDTDSLPRGRPEVAFIYNALNGKSREVGESLPREQHPKRQDWEVMLISDLLRVEAEHVEVDDWKVGFGHDLHTNPVSENLQLQALGLAAARAHDKDRAVVSIVYLPSGRREFYEMGPLELAEVAGRISSIYEAVRNVSRVVDSGGTPNVRTGPHCRYCPAFSACPAQTALVSRLAADPAAVETEVRMLLSPENVGKAYERLLQIEAITSAVRGALAAWARESPIALANGNVYGPVFSEREKVDGPTAWRVLQQLHGDAVADAAVELSTTKTAIEKALRGVAGKGELAGAKRRALQAIEAEGGISTTQSETLKEHRRTP